MKGLSFSSELKTISVLRFSVYILRCASQSCFHLDVRIDDFRLLRLHLRFLFDRSLFDDHRLTRQFLLRLLCDRCGYSGYVLDITSFSVFGESDGDDLLLYNRIDRRQRLARFRFTLNTEETNTEHIFLPKNILRFISIHVFLQIIMQLLDIISFIKLMQEKPNASSRILTCMLVCNNGINGSFPIQMRPRIISILYTHDRKLFFFDRGHDLIVAFQNQCIDDILRNMAYQDVR